MNPYNILVNYTYFLILSPFTKISPGRTVFVQSKGNSFRNQGHTYI
jgi:hypothetical protein